jgi:hypothetical protein
MICLMIGFASAFGLMRDTAGAFAPDKAEGMRIAHALLLCLFAGWFTPAQPNESLHVIDWFAMAILAALAITASKWPPVA